MQSYFLSINITIGLIGPLKSRKNSVINSRVCKYESKVFARVFFPAVNFSRVQGTREIIQIRFFHTQSRDYYIVSIATSAY